MNSEKSNQKNGWKLKDLDYPVPKHALEFGYCLGGIILVGFGLLVITGVIMALFYTPSVAGARISIMNLNENSVGLLLRSFHRWTAEAIIFLIILHLSRIIFTGSYQGKRKLNWFFGIGLLLITFVFFFSGTVIKWDQEGYEAYQHMLEATELMPLGAYIASFLKGTAAVMRMFVTHSLILPLLLFVFLIPHLALVKLNGLSPLPNADSSNSTTFFKHLKKVLIFSIPIYALVVFLSAKFPAVLYPGPYSGVEMTKPPWIFLPLYALEDKFGLIALIIVPIIVVIALILLPYFDSKAGENSTTHKVVVWSFLIIVSISVALIIFVGITPPVQHLNMK
ncbi:MAG: hypothetical protein GXO77_08690 [Calditrichaeota bacterium]|nr:hypothetical protein [Calditrichota bacterium]